MSKYDPLWKYLKNNDNGEIKLFFSDIEYILGFKIDHPFLNYKKEASNYGYTVKKISLKEKHIIFEKLNIS
jgi:hypothetical protein